MSDPLDDQPKKPRRAKASQSNAVAKVERVPAVGWLTLTSYATLQIVQTANYLRFGPHGVRRFGPGAPPNLPHPHTIQIKLTFKQTLGKVLLTSDNIVLHHPNAFDLEGMNIWSGRYEAAHLHITWVWDFYRLLSGIRLALDLSKRSDEWQAAHECLQKMGAGDRLLVEAGSISGDILQIYPFEGLEVEDSPA